MAPKASQRQKPTRPRDAIRAEAIESVARLQAHASEAGLSRLSPSEINDLIRKSRRERKRRKA